MKLRWRLGQWKFSCGCFNYPQVLVVVLFHALLSGLLGDMEPAFLRSTVDCTDFVPDEAGHCLQGFSAVDGLCQPQPTEKWSGSAHCSNAKFVMNKAVQRGGNIQEVHMMGHFIALLVVGPLIDIWGRKPVIMLSIFGELVHTCFWLAAARWVDEHIMMFLLPATFGVGAISLLNPAVSAMVSDMSQATVGGRTDSFSTIKVLEHFIAMVSVGIGFWILGLHLTDYCPVYTIALVFTGLLWALAGMVLRETLPDDLSSSSSLKLQDSSESDGKERPSRKPAICRRGWRMMKEVTRLVRDDRFLFNFIIVQFFKVAAFGIAQALARPFLISHLGYSQQYASLAGLVVSLMVLLGNAFSRILVRRFGPLLVYGASTAVVGLGFFVQGFAGLMARPDLLFWSGLLIAASGLGVADTSGTVLLSLRVHPEAMGVMFSLEHGLGLAGHMVGVFMATHYLFDARAEGWHKSSCFTICSMFTLLSTVWYFVAYFLLAADEDDARHIELDSTTDSEEDNSDDSADSHDVVVE